MSEDKSNIENIAETNLTSEMPCNCGCAEKKICRCKIKKIIVWTIGSIAAITALLLIFRDMYIPYAISKAGTFALGTKVELKKFSSSLTGKVDIQGLSVANPAGYHNPKAFELERVYVNLSVLSLLSNEIVIREILVTGMKIDLESKLNRTNLGDIQKNIERLVPKTDENGENDENRPSEKKSKSVFIEKLDISNNLISFSNSALHLTVDVPLPPITMTDIGGKSIADTLNEIMQRILTTVFDACSSVGGAVSDSLKGAGALLNNTASSIGKDLSNAANDVKKGISDTAKKFFKGF